MSAVTASGPLSDNQVGSELRKMAEFILQEAHEKAREIRTRADEEAEREKAAFIRAEKAAIDAEYAKKFKQLERSDQVARSRASRKARFQVGFEKERVVDSVFEEAAGRLGELSGDDGYRERLKNLILQGLYKFNQPCKVRTRPQDVKLAKSAIEDAVKEYKEKTGNEIEAEMDESKPLAKDSAGGVVVSCGGDKIWMDNTFERRLELLKDESMPIVIETLFGKNPNRKFEN